MKLKKEWSKKEDRANIAVDDPGHDDFASGWGDQGRVMRQTGKKPTGSESKAIAGYSKPLKGLLK